ncbi:hypothetical protein [Lentzea sp. NPDC004782]|uniref:WXG100 family type VII secretion target n=1 Tax=Lentzea sp. NPDC004782 TaxID=3154458 RepID=UPI00339DF549
MAPVKPVVPHPDANYPGQPHEEMKKLVTEKYDPGAATNVAGAWSELGGKFKELAEDFRILVNGSQDAWKGRAAEGVRAALTKVGTFADQTGDGFVRTSGAIAQQRDAAVQANKAMPEPVEFNPLKIAGDWLTNKGGFIAPAMMVGAPIEMISTYNKQQGAKEEAVQVMQTRDNTMMSAAMSMPAMESTPQVTQDQGVTQPSSTNNSSHNLGNVNANQRFSNTGMPNAPTMPSGSNNNGTTNTSWVAPQVNDPSLQNPGNNPNNPPGGQNRPPVTPPGMLPPGMRPPGGGQAMRPGGGPGMRPGMRPGGPGGGLGGGAGRGMGAGGLGGPGAAGRGAGSFGPSNPGGGAGVMGTGPGGTGAGAAGRGGAAGAAGAAGAGGAGHGGKGGEEDKEHKSNYLVPTDEFFDDDRMVAPPVIGG